VPVTIKHLLLTYYQFSSPYEISSFLISAITPIETMMCFGDIIYNYIIVVPAVPLVEV